MTRLQGETSVDVVLGFVVMEESDVDGQCNLPGSFLEVWHIWWFTI